MQPNTSDRKRCNKDLCAEEHSTSQCADTIVSIHAWVSSLVTITMTGKLLSVSRSEGNYFHFIIISPDTTIPDSLSQLIRVVTTPKVIADVEKYMKN